MKFGGNEKMARSCPHCKIRVGTLATTCWKCKLPLDYYDSQLNEVDYKEKKEEENIGKTIIVPLMVVAILVIIVALSMVVGGKFYLLIILIYVIFIAFGSLLGKSRKAEKIMELNKMDPWEEFPLAARARILENIFTAQKLPEWEVKKSELVRDTIIIMFYVILWILLIILIPYLGGGLPRWWSSYSPLIELLTIYILYPIFLVLLIIIYYNDIKIYKSK